MAASGCYTLTITETGLWAFAKSKMSFRRPRRDSCDGALVVTALPLEMRAVRAHVQDFGSCLGKDGTVYECGIFTGEGSEWLVVVAETGAGTHTAQNAVTYAHQAFKQFDVMLFVGVGASRKTDVPIGSVVASSVVYYAHGGKYENGDFAARPRTGAVDPSLIGLARKVERDGSWQARIQAPLKTALPTTEYPQPFPPGGVVAPIISIEAVSADPDSELEQIIAKHYGDAHALEMEGYGAVFAANIERTPAILVRGISDMRARKTAAADAVNQPVAAAHAAAFGMEILNLWGQYYSPTRQSIPIPPQPVVTAPAARPPTSANLVVSFDSTATDFDETTIDRIVAILREATGNPYLRVVTTETGSFHLLLAARPDDLAKIDTETVRESLSRIAGHPAMVSTIEAYDTAKKRKAALGRASVDLMHWPTELADGTWIDRPELGQILARISDHEHSTTVLLGPPGSGKSALLAMLARQLAKEDTPVLAIKADLIDVGVQSEANLADQLDLDGLPSAILEQLARTRTVVLLIDQLDALAGYVDLRTGRLNVLLNLVRKLGAHPNVHIVLSARTFEYEHDVRLKSIEAESLPLELPAWHAVLSILESHGVKAEGWPEDVQQVLRAPQALTTFMSLNAHRTMKPFRTYQAMLDKLWQERILDTPQGHNLSRLASSIAEQMAELETLWLAAARFDGERKDLDALIASGILTTAGVSDGSIGFSHQTLFDHALARGFARDPGRLSAFVLERESSLFIRPKLWAALTYLRDVELQTYENELRIIWFKPDLRLHLRRLLIEFLGQQENPTDFEAVLMCEAFQAQRTLVMQSIVGSRGWFERFADSLIRTAMTESTQLAHLSAVILTRAWSYAPDRVVGLIESEWKPRKDFDSQLWFWLQEVSGWSAAVFDLAALVLGRTPVHGFHFHHMLSTLGAEQPDYALKLTVIKLDRDLQQAQDEALAQAPRQDTGDPSKDIAWRLAHAPERPITQLFEREETWESLEALGRAHPRSFLESLWPWFGRVLAALKQIKPVDPEALYYPLNYLLDYRFDYDEQLGLPETPILGALRVAVEEAAAQVPDWFEEWLKGHQNEDAAPAQRLFAHGMAAQPERFAAHAAQYLLGDRRRFLLGSIHDDSGTSTHLLRTVAPYWSAEAFAAVEVAILAYAPPTPAHLTTPKERRAYRSAIRHLRLKLLSALPAARLSAKARSTLAQDERRFPGREETSFAGASFIGANMSAQAMAKASDADILQAFKTLPDATGWHHPRSWHVGGNIQLSREFGTFAKEHPERARVLIEGLDPVIGTRAASHAIEAMASVVDSALLQALILDLVERGFDSEEFRASIARGLGQLVQRQLPVENAIIALLERWLIEPPPPAPDADPKGDATRPASVPAPKVFPEEKKREAHTGSILWGMHGITVLPHGTFPALETLTHVLLVRNEHERLLKILSEHLAREPDPEVWQALFRLLAYLRPADQQALMSFYVSLFEHVPALAESLEAVLLFARLQWSTPDFVQHILPRLQKSADPQMLQAYGELVTLIALMQPTLAWAKEALDALLAQKGPSPERVGVAYAAVNLWHEDGRMAAALQVIKALALDADSTVWDAIFDLFRLTDEIPPSMEWMSLLETIAENIERVGSVRSHFVIQRLQTLLPHCAETVATIALGLVQKWHNELADMRTSTAAVSPDLVDLAITLHRLGPETRDTGTRLFEMLLELDAYSARETLAQIDNKFSETRHPVRRRLPRRSQNPRSTARGARRR